ncbi:hypothetical protein HK102_005514 [Quaeritorhiza haematococci]|nr:hypothetical protein HK102_005514 [Quaeritorhiza haematococci]
MSDIAEFPSQRVAELVQELEVSPQWGFLEGEDDEDAELDAELEMYEDGIEWWMNGLDRKRTMKEKEDEAAAVVRICSSFIGACVNLNAISFDPVFGSHPLVNQWFRNPQIGFESMFSPALTRIRAPVGLPLRSLRNLVVRCPQLERINVGWLYPPNLSEESVRLTTVLDDVPTLKELDIQWVFDWTEFQDNLERLGTLRCVRIIFSRLISPYDETDLRIMRAWEGSTMAFIGGRAVKDDYGTTCGERFASVQ